MQIKAKYEENYQPDDTGKGMSLIIYDTGEHISTFGIKKESVLKIAPELVTNKKTTDLKEGMIKISGEQFKKLKEAHRKERYRNIIIENRFGEEIKVEIDKGTKKNVLEEIIKAYQNRQPIYIENKEGYAEFPTEEEEETAIYSENGEAHVFYIGITTGKIKKFLQLNDKNASGGTILSTSPIIKAKTDGEERKLFKMVKDYDKRKQEEINKTEQQKKQHPTN